MQQYTRKLHVWSLLSRLQLDERDMRRFVKCHFRCSFCLLFISINALADIDECANSTCGSNRYCSNSKGNFTCGGCYAGYQLQNGTCQGKSFCSFALLLLFLIIPTTPLLTMHTDTDECKSNATICPNSTCNNTIGNYTCGDCYRGYQLQNMTCQGICINFTFASLLTS